MPWWQAWFIAGGVAAFLPLPWNIVVAAPFALWAGWTLVPAQAKGRECGWCGRRFRGHEWCCDECAAYGSDTPDFAR